MKKIFLSCILFLLFNAVSFSQITLVQFAAGFNEPVDIKNAGDNRLFIVERAGYIRIVDSAGVIRPGYFLDIHTIVESGYGEQGLLGLAFSPDYKTSGYFYCYYTRKTTGRIQVSRFSVSSVNPDSAVASSEQVLLDIFHRYLNHDGGHLAFGPDGYLYIGTGDGGSGNDPGNRAQNLDSLMGKILRIDVSGGGAYSIPPSNPFVCVDGRDEIWAYGLRNPWRWSFDQWTGDLWIGDVGQDTWEEVDFQPASSRGGENYGWRCYEGNDHTPGVSPQCFPPNVVYPVHVISQASTSSCSVIGGYVYRGAKYSNLFGKYFFTDYCIRNIKYLLPNGSGGFTATDLGTLTTNTNNNAFGEDMYGELYMSDLNGKIFRFQGQACSPVAFISDLDTITVCGATSTTLRTPHGFGFHYSWSWSGGPVTSDTSAITITQGGNYSVTALDSNACLAVSPTVHVRFATMPSVSFTGLDTLYCYPDPPVTLIGNPAGGIFSGKGVSGSSFSPLTAGVGTYAVTYTFTSDSGCTSSQTQCGRVDGCLGLNGNSSFSEFTIFPNPGHGVLNVSIYLQKEEALKAEVSDVMGRMIFREDMHLNSGSNQFRLTIPGVTGGIYSLRLSNGRGSSVKSFIVN